MDQEEKTIQKKCQWRPSPRFLCPGNAIQEENDSSSSRDIHILFSGIFFLVNLIHSVPGVLSSCQYSFGRALSISMPLLISRVMNIMFIKCAKRIQKGKSSKTTSNHNSCFMNICARLNTRYSPM